MACDLVSGFGACAAGGEVCVARDAIVVEGVVEGAFVVSEIVPLAPFVVLVVVVVNMVCLVGLGTRSRRGTPRRRVRRRWRARSSNRSSRRLFEASLFLDGGAGCSTPRDDLSAVDSRLIRWGQTYLTQILCSTS
jgi:hypothetical protein